MKIIALEELCPPSRGSVNPAKFEDETFELFSIPAFDAGQPEIVKGSEIGSSKQIVENGDILLSKIVPHIRRAWEVTATTEHRTIASSEWIVFKHNDLFPGYLRHVLVGDIFHNQFMQTVSGVGGSLLRARPAQVKLIKIPLPPLPEQKRIAAILDKADAIRRKRKQALDLTDTLLRSTFFQMFGDPASPISSTNTIELAKVTNFIDYRGIAPNKQPEGVRLITARNIKRGWFEENPKSYIPANEYKSWMTRGIPKTGDILFTTEGHTLGSAAQLPYFSRSALAQRLITLQPSQSIRSEYLLYVILDRVFQHQVIRRSTGSAAKGISSKQLAKIPIHVPPIELQQQFSDIVKKAKTKKNKALKHLELAESLFSSLQQKAFKGEL